MRVMVHAVEESVRARVVGLLTAADLEFSPSPTSPQDMCSALYRDPDLFGLIVSASPMFAVMTCRNWREAGAKNPILVLIDDDGPYHMLIPYFVMVLGAGADDVQRADIDGRELKVRIEAVARRDRGPDPVIEFCGCRLDEKTGQVQSDLGTVFLTHSEHVVLSMLTERVGMLVSKRALMDRLYGGRDEAEFKIVDVFVCKLRRKLRTVLGGREVIETVWGQGYRFCADGMPALQATGRVVA